MKIRYTRYIEVETNMTMDNYESEETGSLHFEVIDGILYIAEGDEVVAAYAPGGWLNVRMP
jgi:hypothetical protein